MSLPSLHFLLFLALVWLIHQTLPKSGWRCQRNFLILASYYFYMCWDWRFAGLLAAITLVSYCAAQGIQQASSKRVQQRYLALGVGLPLACLAYFKYSGFLLVSLNDLLLHLHLGAVIPAFEVLLPIGISFFTFQALSYVIDSYRGQSGLTTSLRDYTLYMCFFPHLLAGPIVRASYFLPQLTNSQHLPARAADSGLALILRGFIKKVALADVLGLHVVDPAFSQADAYTSLFLILALYAYSFQVYLDFSGYTDIARGTARILGYEFDINFNRPYHALSISEFWQRWHISMSSFFRDYLYFGLGGSKHGNVYLNLMLTFLAIGLWHGAGWNYLAYGFCHGAMVCYERWRHNRVRRGEDGKTRPLAWVWFLRAWWVLSAVSLTRVLFRSGSLDGAGHFMFALVTGGGGDFPLDVLGSTALLAAILLHYTPQHWAEAWIVGYQNLAAPVQGLVIVLVFNLLLALGTGQAPFIYFQF